MTTGIAAYAGYITTPIEGNLWMAMLNPSWAKSSRSRNPSSYGILRPDAGDDANQVNESNPAKDEAKAFTDHFIIPALAQVPAHTYSATLGQNENWHQGNLKWRAEFELALCNIVQNELGLEYIALSCPVGNLNPDELPMFFDLFKKARWISYHAYLGLRRDRLIYEIDSWWLWRPTRLWLPVLRQARIPLRIMYTECGTGPRPADVGLSKEQLAQLDLDIASALKVECDKLGVEFGGCLPFGFGLQGQMGADWNLDGYEKYFEEKTMPNQWTLGFADYRKTHSEVGDAIEPLNYDDQGNAWQHSTTGLLFWHKAANKTYFFPKA